MLKHILISSLVLIITFNANAQKARKYSNEFLNIGMGASGMAMSNSRVAGTSDLFSMYYNPAGLAHVKEAFQPSEYYTTKVMHF